MPIPLEKQKQVRRYLEKLVYKKGAELESSIQTKEKDYAESEFSKKKAYLEDIFLPAIEKYNAALHELQSLSDQHDYYPRDTDRSYGYKCVENFAPMMDKIHDDSVRDLVKEEYRSSIKESIENRKEELAKKEMEITEKILFAEDDEIYQMVQDLKSIEMEV